MRDRIKPVHFHLFLIRRRSKDPDPGLALLYLPAEVLLPGSVSGNQGGIRLLHGDQDRIVQGIIVEFGERLQIVLESFTLKQRLDTGFQLVGDLLDLIKLGGIGFIFLFRHGEPPFRISSPVRNCFSDRPAVSEQSRLQAQPVP